VCFGLSTSSASFPSHKLQPNPGLQENFPSQGDLFLADTRKKNTENKGKQKNSNGYLLVDPTQWICFQRETSQGKRFFPLEPLRAAFDPTLKATTKEFIDASNPERICVFTEDEGGRWGWLVEMNGDREKWEGCVLPTGTEPPTKTIFCRWRLKEEATTELHEIKVD